MSLSNASSAGGNLYTSGQCTYYVYDKVGGKIGSTWGNANNWANAAASAGYTVNNSPSQGAIYKLHKVHLVTLPMLRVSTAMVQLLFQK